MKLIFNADQFSDLFNLAAQALVCIEDVIVKIEAKIEQCADKRTWWERRFGFSDRSDHEAYFQLQIDLAVRRKRKEKIEWAMSTIGFAISYNAERVELSQEEAELLRLYGTP